MLSSRAIWFFTHVRACTPYSSSAVAQTGLPNHEAIAAAKAGVVGLARSAAATYGKKGAKFFLLQLVARITTTLIGRWTFPHWPPLAKCPSVCEKTGETCCEKLRTPLRRADKNVRVNCVAPVGRDY